MELRAGQSSGAARTAITVRENVSTRKKAYVCYNSGMQFSNGSGKKLTRCDGVPDFSSCMYILHFQLVWFIELLIAELVLTYKPGAVHTVYVLNFLGKRPT